MVDCKKVLLHILAKCPIEALRKTGNEDKALEEFYEHAFVYTTAGEREYNTSVSTYLKSIFADLAEYSSNKGFALSKMALADSFFPKEIPDGEVNSNSIESYLQSFTADFEKILHLQGRVFADTALTVMEQYLTTVPCMVKGLEDVSLFDHLKSLSGFLYCLAHEGIAEKEKPILLIGSDISGIQSFIYDIIGQDASKNLKGRSFYLQLLQDSILRRLLDTLELFQGNVVYASGGGFYILAPNTELVKNALAKEEAFITERVFEEHKTSLSVALASIELSEKELLNNLEVAKDKTVWDKLIQEILKKQKHKHSNLIEQEGGFEQFFKPSEEGGDYKRDAITNEELDFSKKVFEMPDDSDIKKVNEPEVRQADNSRKFIGEITKVQIDLGKALKKMEYISIVSDSSQHKGKYTICGLGYSYLLTQGVPSNSDGILECQVVNDPSRLNHLLGNYSFALTSSFYGGNDFPTFESLEERGIKKTNMPMTFSEMAGQKEAEKSHYSPDFEEPRLKRLGVLRMDVDGLGKIFKQGSFSGDKKTFSRYATLSRSLDYFFTGYLNTIWEEDEDIRSRCQIIYAGGDDLFIVGRWNALISFAEKIRESFGAWTCGCSEIGLSGGIAIVTPKFPIAKAAEMAAGAEAKAKAHEEDGKEERWKKDSFTLLGMPLHWEYEYKIVKDLRTEIINLGEEAVKGPLSKLRAYYAKRQEQLVEEKQEDCLSETRDNNSEKNTMVDHSWRWQLAYSMARAIERYKNRTSPKEFLQRQQTRVFVGKDKEAPEWRSNHDYFTLLDLAIRWAELEGRASQIKKRGDREE